MAHEIGKVGEDNAGVAEIRGIALEPLQGNIAFIVDGTQGQHDVVNGKVSLPHHLVADLAVHHDRIFNVGIFNVCAQVLHRLSWSLSGKTVGMMDIPQGADVVAVNLIQQIPQPGGIGVDAVGFHQQGDILFFRIGDQPAQGGQDDLIVHLPFRGSVAVGQDADIGGAQLGGQIDVGKKFFVSFLSFISVF